MDDKLQGSLTALSLLAAAVWLNSAFYHRVTTVYMRGKKDITQRTATVPVFRGVISPTLNGNTLLKELCFQRNGEKTLACRSRSALT